MNTKLELSPKQIEFLNLATHRWNGKIGATRCGKTHIDVTHVIPERILEREGKKGLNVIFGVSKETVERNVLEPMRGFWGERLVGEINNRNIATLFGQKVYCLGAEKVSQVAKVRGAEFKYAYCDELVDLHKEVFEILKSRLSLEYSMCDFTGNPAGPSHHIKKFIDEAAEKGVDLYCQSWTIYDNPFLPPSYVKSLESEYRGSVYFDRYILGKWALAEGLVYPMFSQERHVVPESKMPHNQLTAKQIQSRAEPYEKYCISGDYGTLNPCAFLLLGLKNGVWYEVKEYYYDGRVNTPRTDEEHYNALEELAGDLYIDSVIIDPSAASFITLIRKRKKFKVKPADNAVTDGIRETATVIKRGLLKVGASCKRTIEEFEMYSWDNKATEDKPIKENDHCMDALRYFVKTMHTAIPKKKWFI